MESAAIFDVPHLRPLGRYRPSSAHVQGALPLLWAGSGLEVYTTASELRLLAEADFGLFEPWLLVELNGAPIARLPLERGLSEVTLYRGMAPGSVKRVRVFKDTQPMQDDPAHRLWVRGLAWEGGEFLPAAGPKLRLEFVGDSLTSGEGVLGAREEEDWFPAIFSACGTWAKGCADLLGADFRLISQSGWGVRSGWDNDPTHALPDGYGRVCSPALGPKDLAMGSQYPNEFELWRPDAVIVNLGTNDLSAMSSPGWERDGVRFAQTGDEAGLRLFENAALDFLRRLRAHNPGARLVWAYGMAGDGLRAPLERAVDRFNREDGGAYYLPLPPMTPDTTGSRQHPGPLCHRAAAAVTAEFLRKIL